MTSEEYKLLTIDGRANVLWKEGTFLSEVIEYGKFVVNIYELHKFFVGVYYSVNENKIVKIEVLETDWKEKLFENISPN